MHKSIFDSIGSGIIQDFPDGVVVVNLKNLKIVEINRTAILLMGYKEREELVGKDISFCIQ